MDDLSCFGVMSREVNEGREGQTDGSELRVLRFLRGISGLKQCACSGLWYLQSDDRQRSTFRRFYEKLRGREMKSYFV